MKRLTIYRLVAWLHYVLACVNFWFYLSERNPFSLIATICFTIVWLCFLVEADDLASREQQ